MSTATGKCDRPYPATADRARVVVRKKQLVAVGANKHSAVHRGFAPSDVRR